MKKYFLSIVALAVMLFATSCQESLVEPQVGGTTTFTVQLPDAMGTKAIGDASIIDRLYVAVYENFDENGGTLPTSAIYKTNVPVSGGVATVALNLIQGQKYDIVFWAQNGTSYVDENSELLSIPMKNIFHNNEEGAAFFHFEPNFEPKGYAKGITLRRPFAQLNLGTTEESLETDLGDVTLIKSKVVVSSVATSFNTVTGEGVAETTTSATYEANIVFDQCLTVSGKDYVYISMDYLPIVGDNQALVTVAAEIKLENGQVISHEFTNVPVKENYRTNIVGNLISSSTDFNVVVDAEFDGELPQTDLEKLQFVAANGGEVILQGPVALVESLVITAGVTKSQAESSIPVVIDLNGHTISQSQVQTGAYSMINNRGNLTIKDSKGTGKIIYGDQGNGGNYASNTILNSGVLVIEGGSFVNESSSNVVANGFPHVIDNNGDLIVRGGTFVNEEYSSVRIWAADNHTNVDIYAGKFTGAIDLQNPGNGANHIGNLNIYGGTFNASNFTNKAVVRFLNFGDDNSGMSINIFGGTFNNVLGRSTGAPTFIYSDIFHISGGIFSTDEVDGEYELSDLLVDGTKFIVKDGKYYVVEEDVDENIVVTTASELEYAMENGQIVQMICDIDVPENTVIKIPSGITSTVNMNGYTISSSNNRSETHNDFILVKGTLNIENGHITYIHTGANMEWNGCTNLFDITAGGVLNIKNVTANNLGGTDMNFAVHMNNWGEVTLNAENCEFLSTYCGVRVFNSGYDMNNVTIKNSKLTGLTRAFWVHNYIGDLNSAQHTDDAIKNRLNFSLYNNNNTFEISGEAVSPIIYGFNKPIYYILSDSNDELYIQNDNDVTYAQYYGEATDVVVPAKVNGLNVTVLGSYVFNGANITSVSLPEGLKVIDNRAFRDCKISTVQIPSTVETIVEGAFQKSSITSIVIPENVTSIGKISLGACGSLEKIEIRAKNITIANYCARGCMNLREVYIYSENVTFAEDGNARMYFTNEESNNNSSITFYVQNRSVADALNAAVPNGHAKGMIICNIDGTEVYYTR